MKRIIVICLIISLSCLLIGCTAKVDDESVAQSLQPSPTMHPFLSTRSETAFGTPSTSKTLPPAPTFNPVPDPASSATISATSLVQDSGVVLFAIYDDVLNADWTLENSENVNVVTRDIANPREGNYAMSITPQSETIRLDFMVSENATQSYVGDAVLGIGFWLNTGEGSLEVGALQLSVLASNDFSYWVANDDSANDIESLTYSGNRTYSLDINQAIPPETWVRVEVFLDDLVFDPDYDDEAVDDPGFNYLTGFSLQGVGVEQTFYLDEIELIMAKD